MNFLISNVFVIFLLHIHFVYTSIHGVPNIRIPFIIDHSKKVAIMNICLTLYSDQCFPVLLSTTTFKPFILGKEKFGVGYDHVRDPVHDVNISFQFGSFSLGGYLIRETLTIPNTMVDIDYFFFYYTNKGDLPFPDFSYVGIMGLAIGKDTICSSLVDSVFRNFKVPKVFSIRINRNEEKGQLTFGEFARENIGSQKQIKKCALLPFEDVFACEIKRLFYYIDSNLGIIMEKMPLTSAKILLNPGFYGIRVPNSIFEYLTKKIFNNALSNFPYRCSVKENRENNRFISCDTNFAKATNFGEIKLFVGNFNFSLNLNQLFRNNNDGISDLLIYNHKKFTHWVIGNYFLDKNINEIIYDVDNQLIFLFK